MAGAAVTLFEAGTDYGSNATSLGSATTDASGKFRVSYTPPASPAVLYLLARGGNAGGGSNTAIGLMGVAGMSNALPASVTINELTTGAAQWALAQFIDSTGQVIGAPSSNATGFANAVNQTQTNLADIASGGPANFWSTQDATEANCTGGSPPINCDGLERLDTIANILAACVESSGPLSSACSTLLTNTGGGSTTLAAAHVMATNPVAKVATLFALQSGSPPYTPELIATPDGFEIALNFAPIGSKLDELADLAVDAAGNVWVTNELTVISTGGGSVTKLTSSGGLVGNFAPSGANFNEPIGLAIDAAGNAWVSNAKGNSVTELTSSGSLVGNFTPSGANFSAPVAVAIDAAGNVWVPNCGSGSGSGCVINLGSVINQGSVTKLNSSGGLIGNFTPSGANFSAPTGLAIDAAGNAWIPNAGNSVTELNSSGALVGNFAPSGANFNLPVALAIDAASNAWVPNFGGKSVTELNFSGALVGNFAPSDGNLNQPDGVAIDAADNVWVPNFGGNSVTELNSSGILVGNFAPPGANFNEPGYTAIDAAGNVWVPNFKGDSVTELIGVARPVLTPLVACLNRPKALAVCLP